MDNKITSAAYLPEVRELAIKFSSGARLHCPIDALKMLTWTGTIFVESPRPTDKQLANVRVRAGGYAIDFPDIKQNFSIEELLSLLPSPRMMTEVIA